MSLVVARERETQIVVETLHFQQKVDLPFISYRILGKVMVEPSLWPQIIRIDTQHDRIGYA